ncbi:hypothetical protein AB0M20_26405, partial [Actinoplanes sp. NPDC051633]
MRTRYELDTLTARRITAITLAAHPGTGRYACFVTGPDGPLADVARAVEREVFQDTFGNDTAVMTAEYGPYEQQSR